MSENFTIFLYCRGMERFSTIELNQVFLGNLDYSYGLVLLSLYSSRLVDTSCFTLTASGIFIVHLSNYYVVPFTTLITTLYGTCTLFILILRYFNNIDYVI